MNKKRIGILGGTFNPIHIGHLILAENAYSLYNLDYVLIMPNGVAYFKKNIEIVDSKDRIAMIELAIKDNEHFVIDTRETLRKGNSYTCDTIIELRNEYPEDELFYIFGADTLYNIEKWKNPEVIFSNCTLLVAARDNYSEEDLFQKCDELRRKYNAKVELMDTCEIEISSTDIRKRLRSNNGIRYYVPDSVNEYIIQNKLFL